MAAEKSNTLPTLTQLTYSPTARLFTSWGSPPPNRDHQNQFVVDACLLRNNKLVVIATVLPIDKNSGGWSVYLSREDACSLIERLQKGLRDWERLLPKDVRAHA